MPWHTKHFNTKIKKEEKNSHSEKKNQKVKNIFWEENVGLTLLKNVGKNLKSLRKKDMTSIIQKSKKKSSKKIPFILKKKKQEK